MKFVRKTISYVLMNVCDMHSVHNLVVFLTDFNGHVGRHIDGFTDVH